MESFLQNQKLELTQLSAARFPLANSLTQLARDMQQGVCNIDENLLAELEQLRSKYDLAVKSLQHRFLAEQVDWNPLAVHSLPRLSETLEQLAETLAVRQQRQQQVEQALQIVRTAEKIAHVREADFAPLQVFRSGLQELKSQLDHDDATSQTLTQDLLSITHPVAALVQWVQDDGTLDDASWERLQSIVEEEFSTKLATAVVRGRLAIVEPEQPQSDSIEAAADKAADANLDEPGEVTASAAAIADHTGDAREDDAVTEPEITDSENAKPEESQAGGILVSARTPKVAVPVSPINEPTFKVETAPEPVEIETASATKSDDDEQRPSLKATQQHAAVITAANAVQQGRATSDSLIAALIHAGQHGMAAQLLRDSAFMPSAAPGLLIVARLANSLRTADGDIAITLQRLADRLDMQPLQKRSAHELPGFALLVIAASLRPALLAPSVEVSHWLADLPMLPGLHRLYNLVHRVARFSDDGKPLNPRQFRSLNTMAEWQAEMDDFAHTVRSWRENAPLAPVRYVPATHCFLRSHWSLTAPRPGQLQTARKWRIWQQSVIELEAVLDAAMKNDEQSLSLVRSAEQHLRETLADTADPDGEVTADAAALETWRRRILGFLQRRLALQEAHPIRGHRAVPHSAEDVAERARVEKLRDEILSRADEVDAELQAWGAATDELTAAMAELCRKAVADLQAIFAGHEQPLRDEPEPWLLTHRELLSVPEFNPATDDLLLPPRNRDGAKLSTAIIRQLAGQTADSSPDWNAVYKLRLDRRQFVAAGRMLELGDWKDSSEQKSLQELWTKAVARAQSELQQELATTNDLLEHLSQAGVIDTATANGFRSQLAHLEATATNRLNFDNMLTRLAQLQEQLQARRTDDLEQIRLGLMELTAPVSDSTAAAEGAFRALMPTVPAAAEDGDEWIW